MVLVHTGGFSLRPNLHGIVCRIEPLDPVLVIVLPGRTFEMGQGAVGSECAAHSPPAENTKVTSSAVGSPSANYTGV